MCTNVLCVQLWLAVLFITKCTRFRSSFEHEARFNLLKSVHSVRQKGSCLSKKLYSGIAMSFYEAFTWSPQANKKWMPQG